MISMNNQLWVIGVSGGCDSMMLMDYLRRQGIQLIVAHVNYHQRPSADRDQSIVQNYCQQHNLIFKVMHPTYQKGNFQQWARNVRYAWFAQLVEQYHCVGIMVAHHLNDVVETFLMQQQGRQGEYYGIKTQSKLYGCMVYRPLLVYSKKQLVDYCAEYNLTFGEDETNQSTKYTRNAIRKSICDIDETQLREYEQQIAQLNQAKQLQDAELTEALASMTLTSFSQLSIAYQEQLLRRLFIIEELEQSSKRQVKAIIQQLVIKSWYPLSNSKWIALTTRGLVVEEIYDFPYNVLMMSSLRHQHRYWEYNLTGPENCGVSVLPSDFPLTIRSWIIGDSIVQKYGTKKLNRWFIDHKVPPWLRKIWPVIVNSQNEVVYIAGIGRSADRQSLPINAYLTFNKGDSYVKK